MTAAELITVNQIIEMLKMQEELRSELRAKDDRWREEITEQIKDLHAKLGEIPEEIATAIEKCREVRESLTAGVIARDQEREAEKIVLHRLSVRVRYSVALLSGLVAILTGLLAYFQA